MKKQENLRPVKIISALLILASSLLIIGAADHSFGEKGKVFAVAKVGSKTISRETQGKLLKAFRAQYGQKALVESITLEQFEGKTWLAFLGGGDGTPTVSIALKVINGQYAIDFGGPLQINNCLTTDSCSCCNTSCKCSKKNGGQVSCGSGDCTSVKTDDFIPSDMASVLIG
jgi:hypothetical protein